jgi:hypothetical protein
MKSISAVKINDMIFLKGYSISTEDWRFSYGPYHVGMINDGEEALGKLCLETFDECKTDIPHPEDTRSLKSIRSIDPFADSEEKKSLDKLKKKNRDYRLSVDYDGNKYSFVPLKVLNKQAAINTSEDKTLYSDGDPKNLGKTLLQAFELCE